MDNRTILDFQLFHFIENYELDEIKSQKNIIKLVRDGADLAATDNGKTPMELLAKKDLWPIIIAIAKIKKRTTNDPYRFDAVLLDAVSDNQYEAVKALCEADAKQTWYFDKATTHNYCLHASVKNNHPQILRLLKQHGGNVHKTNGITQLGFTPLELACDLKHWECAGILLEKQHIPFTLGSFDAFKKAFKAKKFNIADGVIRAAGGPNVLNPENDGNTILHSVITQWPRLGDGADLILDYVLRHGLKQKTLNHKNQTAIELASKLALSSGINKTERWRCIKLLIDAMGDLKPKDIINFHLEKVLQNAVKDQNFAIVQLLLLKGVPCTESNMEIGNIALHWAVKTKNSKILNLLLEYGADPALPYRDGTNTLDFAKKINDAECLLEFDKHIDFEVMDEMPSVTKVGLFQPTQPVTDKKVIKTPSMLNSSAVKRF